MEGSPTPDGDDAASGTRHLTAQGVEKLLELDNLRLPGGIDNGGVLRRPCPAQHGIFRGPHAGELQGHHSAPGTAPAGDGAVLLLHLAPHGPQGLQVQVDGPGAQLTAAGIGEGGLPHPGGQRAQKHNGGPHGPHTALVNGGARGLPGIHHQFLPLPAAAGPQVLEDVHGGVHVGQAGTVANHHRLGGQQAPRQNGEHTVFRPLDPPCPLQRGAALYVHDAHENASLSFHWHIL